jgi:hypothetical protein
MGSRQAESEALVDRCRRAGWRIERGARGYKVYNGANQMFPVHLTYGDRTSLANATRRIIAGGLEYDEKALESARLTETRTRNDVAREKAEERAEQMAAKTSIARAAGPYLVDCEDVGLDWLVTPHPAPWMRWCNISSEMAAKILKDHNNDNRPLSFAVRDRYRDIILAGMWQLTHQGSAFDTRGILQDGQHRKAALVEAAKLTGESITLPFAVFVGMPPENFKVIDEGALRVARQLFAKGGEKNTSALQSMIRLVYYYQDGDARRAARLRLPNQIVVDVFGKDEDGYRESTNWAVSRGPKIRGMNVASLAAAHYLIRKVNGKDNEYVRQFFAAIADGAVPGTRLMLNEDDPRYALRKKLADIKDATDRGRKSERRSGLSQVGMILATWNNMVRTNKIRNLYFNEDTAIPEILRCIPGEGGVPSLFLSPKNGSVL